MKRKFSDVLLIVYVGALLILLAWAGMVTYDLLNPSANVAYVLPPAVMLAVSYGIPTLIAVRIWTHLRARRRAAAAVVASEPETGND
ncbi:MAG: hypothetical protein Q8L23_12780 [Caulobacter sp.]|nr:hypothetical protein [Caulobacter sp.]